ncbi:putative transcriptional regulator, PucR family [Sulfobacillus acidophilus DSM 10332]|uniref:Transcriptional regulator, PucR family n=1 Tax=Sulfobacillus acidophilus (strain ATCC 700253 / DSM 10332 / NAL) TaxID=679936 RepID=G8TSR4_SULAD|nr:putative transcriptional regulator, PucR family [Sulfobacillus acidophilus DSM 10332]
MSRVNNVGTPAADAWQRLINEANSRGHRLITALRSLQSRWARQLGTPYEIRDTYGVRVIAEGDLPSRALTYVLPLRHDDRVFASVMTPSRVEPVTSADFHWLALELALILTELQEWAETEAERRGEKLRMLEEQGLTADVLELLTLCGFRSEGPFAVAGVQLASGPRFQAMEVLRRYWIAHRWRYQQGFPWIAYRPNGMMIIQFGESSGEMTRRLTVDLVGWRRYRPDLSVRAYVAEARTVNQLPMTIRDVETILDFGERFHLTGLLNSRVDRQWVRFLVDLKPDQLEKLVRETLGALLDPVHHELLETLAGYLDANQSLAAKAQKLYVHPNTVWYRVRRAEQLLGVHLKETEQLSRIWVALQGYYLLSGR